jgi:hypothetical protein
MHSLVHVVKTLLKARMLEGDLRRNLQFISGKMSTPLDEDELHDGATLLAAVVRAMDADPNIDEVGLTAGEGG